MLHGCYTAIPRLYILCHFEIVRTCVRKSQLLTSKLLKCCTEYKQGTVYRYINFLAKLHCGGVQVHFSHGGVVAWLTYKPSLCLFVYHQSSASISSSELHVHLHTRHSTVVKASLKMKWCQNITTVGSNIHHTVLLITWSWIAAER